MDDPIPTIPPIVINEVLSASVPPDLDAIELFNPTETEVDVGGWFLTDDPAQPMKFRIPAGTKMSAGGFAVFDESDFNPTPGLNTSFALSSDGDEVYLISGDAATNLTGYSHGFSFGAAASGVTFGRHLLSTGQEDFAAQIAPSLRETNVGPLVGPVVISEIHYHPAPGSDEFVELKNISATNVALFDPIRPANTWKLNGLGYTFPTNIILDPGQWLLLVATNPADFRARVSVPEDVPVLGPWNGALQNSGERLELQRPGVPGLTGIVPFITVDAVRYNDKAPWPTAANGRGPSLQRLSDDAYGNDPASWLAAFPTPGRSQAGGPAPAISTQPINVRVFPGDEAEFHVEATGDDPLFYQWHYNSTPIAGATNATLTFTNLEPSQSGQYAVVVYNESGTAESEPPSLRWAFRAKLPRTCPASAALALPDLAPAGGTLCSAECRPQRIAPGRAPSRGPSWDTAIVQLQVRHRRQEGDPPQQAAEPDLLQQIKHLLAKHWRGSTFRDGELGDEDVGPLHLGGLAGSGVPINGVGPQLLPDPSQVNAALLKGLNRCPEPGNRLRGISSGFLGHPAMKHLQPTFDRSPIQVLQVRYKPGRAVATGLFRLHSSLIQVAPGQPGRELGQGIPLRRMERFAKANPLLQERLADVAGIGLPKLGKHIHHHRILRATGLGVVRQAHPQPLPGLGNHVNVTVNLRPPELVLAVVMDADEIAQFVPGIVPRRRLRERLLDGPNQQPIEVHTLGDELDGDAWIQAGNRPQSHDLPPPAGPLPAVAANELKHRFVGS